MGSVLTWWASFWLRVLWGKEPAVSYELRSSVGAADKELKHGGVTVVGCIPVEMKCDDSLKLMYFPSHQSENPWSVV